MRPLDEIVICGNSESEMNCVYVAYTHDLIVLENGWSMVFGWERMCYTT